MRKAGLLAISCCPATLVKVGKGQSPVGLPKSNTSGREAVACRFLTARLLAIAWFLRGMKEMAEGSELKKWSELVDVVSGML
jgi:hypothetical protein